MTAYTAQHMCNGGVTVTQLARVVEISSCGFVRRRGGKGNFQLFLKRCHSIMVSSQDAVRSCSVGARLKKCLGRTFMNVNDMALNFIVVNEEKHEIFMHFRVHNTPQQPRCKVNGT